MCLRSSVYGAIYWRANGEWRTDERGKRMDERGRQWQQGAAPAVTATSFRQRPGSAQHFGLALQRERAVCDSQVVEEGACELSTMGLVSFPKVILPAFLASCVPAYIFWDLARNRKIFGGDGSSLWVAARVAS